jgi:hypothetical protein
MKDEGTEIEELKRLSLIPHLSSLIPLREWTPHVDMTPADAYGRNSRGT